MVRDEVYEPAGIHHAVKFHTIESDPASEAPLTDAGLLLTIDDVAALGKLILDGGKIQGQQILDPQLLNGIFSFDTNKGLPTGIYTEHGQVHYYSATWHLPYQSRSGQKMWIPTMKGYGGQYIQILPNRTISFRFGFDSYETDERYDGLKLVRLADAIDPF
jgi:CubicO group peptidase (beta-lactamase class C family)